MEHGLDGLNGFTLIFLFASENGFGWIFLFAFTPNSKLSTPNLIFNGTRILQIKQIYADYILDSLCEMRLKRILEMRQFEN